MRTEARLAAIFAILAMPAAARAGWEIGAYTGAAHTQNNALRIDQSSTNTHLSLAGIHYQGQSFSGPLYYGLRAAYSFTAHLGIEFEFTHLKLYAKTGRPALAQGTLRGAPISAVVPAGAVVQSFSISHGVNLLLANAVFRLPLLPSPSGPAPRLALTARVGAGGSHPHPESQVLGAAFQHYQWGGYSLQAAAGLEYRVWHGLLWLGEYKFTRVHERVDISGGTAEGWFNSHHVVTGAAYRF